MGLFEPIKFDQIDLVLGFLVRLNKYDLSRILFAKNHSRSIIGMDTFVLCSSRSGFSQSITDEGGLTVGRPSPLSLGFLRICTTCAVVRSGHGQLRSKSVATVTFIGYVSLPRSMRLMCTAEIFFRLEMVFPISAACAVSLSFVHIYFR